jgi:hypothetical protein
MLLVENYKRLEQKTEIRLWKVIEIVTACLGRKSPLPPEDVFPSLKGLAQVEEQDDGEDIDPRESFRQIASITRARTGG